MKPQFVIDGEVIAEGGVCNTGYTQKYIITLSNKASSQNNSEITNNVIVGGMYSIVLDYGNVSEIELKNAKAIIDDFSTIVSEYNCYTEQYMGEILYSIGKLYFSQLDIYNEIAAGVHNVTSTRSLSLGIIGFKADVTYTFGAPSEITEGGLFLDIGHDVHSVVSSDNNNESEKKFMLETGMYASAMEHGVLEQVTGIESVSTIKALQYAQNNNVKLHYINKDNLENELVQISFSDQLISEIRSSVNTGKIIIIPEREITINQWTGVGYMVLDPDTYACGYMISGGMAGGAMTWDEVLLKLGVNIAIGLVIGIACIALIYFFPVLFYPIVAVACIGALFTGISVGTHLYNAIENKDFREFQEAAIEFGAFALTIGIFEKFGGKINKFFETKFPKNSGNVPEENIPDVDTPEAKAEAEAEAAKSNQNTPPSSETPKTPKEVISELRSKLPEGRNAIQSDGYPEGNVGKVRGKLSIDGETVEVDNNAYSKYGSAKHTTDGDLVYDSDGNVKVNQSPDAKQWTEYPKDPHYSDSVSKVKGTYRYNDSECKLIEFLSHLIGDCPNPSGEVEIITERPPCDSCQNVIKTFSEDFPNIKITVSDGAGGKYTIQGGVITYE